MHWRLERMRTRLRNGAARSFFRKERALAGEVGPVVSFTFDDFPKSAATEGAAILERHGARGTFYASLSKLDHPDYFSVADLRRLFLAGHELGCHTYSHVDCWKTGPFTLREEVCRNRLALQEVVPGCRFTTFAYPYAHVSISAKAVLGPLFRCARGGVAAINRGLVDANLLSAHTLFASSGAERTGELVGRAAAQGGWLIFLTHDVQEAPSRYGCTPGQLEEAVRLCGASGATILTVAQALEAFGVG